MASYSVKLVNHTRATDRLQQSIKMHLQGLFDQVFDGTNDKAAVDWGTGAASDSIVLHFVQDVDHSYLSDKWPGNEIRADAGGHTRTRGKISGSEFYFRSGGTHLHDVGYAKLAFHEALHNQFPGWSNDDLHGSKGGGGLAASPPQLPMTDTNKEMMRRGLAVKNEQLL
ncbi:MAG TPA: hypothetical protein VMS17_24765 [Gemmataceae bacterium]|nr:hypothetical protein [Gemmataceae bacterium]